MYFTDYDFEQIKAGDEVIVWESYDQRIASVARVTKTQIILDHPNPALIRRYRRTNGQEVGASVYYGTRISPVTEESLGRFARRKQSQEEERLRNQLTNDIRKVSMRDVSLENLKAAWELLKPKEED